MQQRTIQAGFRQAGFRQRLQLGRKPRNAVHAHKLSRWAEMETRLDVEAVRQALLAEVARDRQRPRYPVTVPVPERRQSPLPSGIQSEDLELCTERANPQGWVPLRIIYKRDDQQQQEVAGAATNHLHAEGSSASKGHGVSTQHRLPVVIFLHPTGSNKDSVRGKQEEYAYAGYLTVAMDCRYHGERAKPEAGQTARAVYEDALVRAWREGPERPFLLDNVWDIMHVVDYLLTRPDVDPDRIGITGFSLGGMHAWLAGAADPRIAVVAAVSGVQGFGWAIANEFFQARVDSIPRVFAAAAADLGKPAVDAEVVSAVWNRITPGLMSIYDAHLSLPCIAPRPLLVATGELDPRCPLQGLLEACHITKDTYLEVVAKQRRELQDFLLSKEQAVDQELSQHLSKSQQQPEELQQAETVAAVDTQVHAVSEPLGVNTGATHQAMFGSSVAEGEAGDGAGQQSCGHTSGKDRARLDPASSFEECNATGQIPDTPKDGTVAAAHVSNLPDAGPVDHKLGQKEGDSVVQALHEVPAGLQVCEPGVSLAMHDGGALVEDNSSSHAETAAHVGDNSDELIEAVECSVQQGMLQMQHVVLQEEEQSLVGGHREPEAQRLPHDGDEAPGRQLAPTVESANVPLLPADGLPVHEAAAEEQSCVVGEDEVAAAATRLEGPSAEEAAAALERQLQEQEDALREAAEAAELARLQAEAKEREEVAAVVSRLMVLFVDPGVGHTETMRMNLAVREFMDTHLMRSGQGLSSSIRRDVRL